MKKLLLIAAILTGAISLLQAMEEVPVTAIQPADKEPKEMSSPRNPGLSLFSLTAEEQKFLEETLFKPFRSTRNSLSPLDWAALKGNTEACKILIDQGADPNDNAHLWGLSPLNLAAATGQGDTCRALLEEQADPNKGPEGFNALYFARRHPKIFADLVEKKAQGMLAAVARDACSPEIYSFILEKEGLLNLGSTATREALKKATLCGNTTTCRFILENGDPESAKLNIGNKDFYEYCTACLCHAAEQAQKETCALLCEWLKAKGYKVNAPDILETVIKKGFHEIGALLLIHGTCIPKDKWQPLLEEAMKNGNIEMSSLIATQTLAIPEHVDDFSSLEEPVRGPVQRAKKAFKLLKRNLRNPSNRDVTIFLISVLTALIITKILANTLQNAHLLPHSKKKG